MVFIDDGGSIIGRPGFRNGDGGDFDLAVFFEFVVAGELMDGFAAKTEGGGRGEFHVTEGLVDTADVLDFHIGQFGEGLAKECIAEVALGVVGGVFDMAPGFNVADEAGVVEEFVFVFHNLFVMAVNG